MNYIFCGQQVNLHIRQLAVDRWKGRHCRPPSCLSRPEYIPGKISDPNYVRIFDTTLRDGEQSPGATITSKEKLAIARQLAKLKVDIIEAGFPVASPDDFHGVQQIAQTVGQAVSEEGYTPVICGLSRARSQDIHRAWEAIKDARLPRIHTFIATSDVHMKHKLRMTPDQVVKTAVESVKLCRTLGCNDIEFSPEDAGRSDPDFLYHILAEVIKAGATTLNIPDTTGWTLPFEYGPLIERLRENTPGSEDIVFSCHCHNDLGLATANSIAGAVAGARQIECTINAIGERAGNTSMEEFVMALKLRGPELMDGLRTGIATEHIYPTSRMVADYSGMVVQPHKAIVGANAFAHESGIHQDGMLKAKNTYEIMSPETIGLVRADTAGIVLGKHSGRHALGSRLKELGYDLSKEELQEVFVRFKALAEQKAKVEDEDLVALVGDELKQETVLWVLDSLQVMCGTMGLTTATAKLRGPDGILRIGTGTGTGPVDAAYRAIDALVAAPCRLVDYTITSVTDGIDAQAKTRVLIEPEEKLANHIQVKRAYGGMMSKQFHGSGSHVDIVVASARAYIAALNKMIAYLASRAGEDDDEEADSTSSIEEPADGAVVAMAN